MVVSNGLLNLHDSYTDLQQLHLCYRLKFQVCIRRCLRSCFEVLLAALKIHLQKMPN